MRYNRLSPLPIIDRPGTVPLNINNESTAGRLYVLMIIDDESAANNFDYRTGV